MVTHLFLAAALHVADTSAHPGISIEDRTEYYRVAGDSAQDIFQQMRALGPIDESTGERFDGYTRWNTSWNYGVESAGRRCGLAKADVSLDVVITLPKWEPGPAARHRLVAGWPTYLSKLEAHEQGHRSIAVQAAEAVHDALATADPQPTCKQLMDELDRVAKEALEQYRQANRDYDRDTDHGAKEGVKLPW
jgi:predicted secreted Zn-dependent protease